MDGFQVVAVGVDDEGPVITGVVLGPDAASAVVAPARGEGWLSLRADFGQE